MDKKAGLERGMDEPKNRIFHYLLPISILVAIIINVLVLRNLFTTFFFEDDFAFLDFGAQLKSNPLLFFTYTFGIYWRPLGFGLIALLYQVFGIHPLPYHIVGYFFHLVAAFSVYLLGNKLYGRIVASFATLLYISYPIAILAVGYITTAFQDQLATFCFLMTFYWLWDEKGRYKKRAYWLPGLMFLLGALCKDSFIALYPSLFIVDWINYKDSTIVARLRRLYPLLLALLVIPIRLLLVSTNRIVDIAELHLGGMIYPENLVWGLVQVFLPMPLEEGNIVLPIIFLVVSALFICISLILLKERRSLLTALLLAMILVTAMVSITVPNIGLRGWAHFQFNAAIASLFIAGTITWLLGQVRWKPGGLIASYAAVSLFIALQYGSYKGIINIYENKSKVYEASVESFTTVSRNLPAGTHIYMISGPLPHLVRDAMLPNGFGYTLLRIMPGDAQNDNAGDMITGDIAYIMRELAPEIAKPETRVLMVGKGGGINDITEVVREHINSGTPFQFYRGRF